MDENTLLQQLAATPHDVGAALKLEALYAGQGRWPELADRLISRLDITDDGAARLDIFEEVAEVFSEKLSAHDHALLVLLQAFEESGDDARFGPDLAKVATASGEWPRLLERYEARWAALGEGVEAAPVCRRLAGWYAALGEASEAERCWTAVLEQDPEDTQAFDTLQAAFEARGDGRAMVGLLVQLAERTFDPTARGHALRRAARLLETRLDAPREAMQFLGEVFITTQDPGVEAHIERLAEETGDWAGLVSIYQAILEGTVPDARALVPHHLRLAEVYQRHLNDLKKAAEHYELALTFEPDSVRALSGLKAIFEAAEAWPELAKVLAREAGLTTESKARGERYRVLGDLLRDRLKDDKGAVDAWIQTLRSDPSDRRALVRLLDVYGEGGHWASSIKVLKKLVKLTEDPKRRAQFAYAIGIIQRDELEDHYVAVRTLDRALDYDPTLVKAFQAIDEILTDDHDYARQDRYYRKMLVRAQMNGLDDALVVNLARNLGEINRSRLGHYEEALKAYRIVLALQPSCKMLELVAELSETVGRPEEAAHYLFCAVEMEPARAKPYRELLRIHQGLGDLDAAWLMCQALTAAGQASEDERGFYTEGRGLRQVARGLDAASWALIDWPGRSEALDAVLHRAWPLLARGFSFKPKDLGLNPRKSRLDVNAPSPLGDALRAAAAVQGVEVPATWYAPERAGLSVVRLEPPSICAGHDLEARAPTDLRFLAARAVYLTRQAHLLLGLEDEPERRMRRLWAIVASMVQVSGSDAITPKADPRLRTSLAKIAAGEGALVERLVPELEARGPDYGVAEWLNAVDYTADRLGLLLCDNLGAAIRLARQNPQPLGGASADERVRALMVFAISEPYRQLRQHLGLALA